MARPCAAHLAGCMRALGLTSVTTPTNPGDSLSRRRKLLYILMLGALTALGPFTVDLYLPAFPALEESLGVSEAAVQLTLTGTTIGFAARPAGGGPAERQVRPADAADPGHRGAHHGLPWGGPVDRHHDAGLLPGADGHRRRGRRRGGHGDGAGPVQRIRHGADVLPDGPGERPGTDPGAGDRFAAAAVHAVAGDLLLPGRLRHVRPHRRGVRGARDAAPGTPRKDRHDRPPALRRPVRATGSSSGCCWWAE